MSLEVEFTRETFDRLTWLVGITGSEDEGEVVRKACLFLDRIVCAAVLDGSPVRIHHRHGGVEEIDPTKFY